MAAIFTIGFSGKKEDGFHDLLGMAGALRVVDVRLWRASRFVPWASGDALQKRLGRRYEYMPELSPTKELLVDYKEGRIDWDGYETAFNSLLTERRVERLFDINSLDGACFLCSEKTADMCHRRLVAEYLAGKFGGVRVAHL